MELFVCLGIFLLFGCIIGIHLPTWQENFLSLEDISVNPLLNAMCDIYYVFYFIWEIKYIQGRTLYFCFTFLLTCLPSGCFATILDGLAVGDFTVWGRGFPYIYLFSHSLSLLGHRTARFYFQLNFYQSVSKFQK